MGSVRIVESVERDGSASVSTIEYEFSDSVDFLAWESDRAERTNAAVKSFASAMYADPEGPMVADVVVKKKDTKH
ncbi:hypothetical protein D3C86_1159460 [compost metagenome]